MLTAVLFLQVGGGIWYLVTFYRTRGQTLEDCLNGTTDTKRIAYCDSLNAYKRVPQAVMIVSVLIPIIYQAYACYVVYQYSKRLENQKIESLRSSRAFIPPVGPAYEPIKPMDDTYALTQPNPHYHTLMLLIHSGTHTTHLSEGIRRVIRFKPSFFSLLGVLHVYFGHYQLWVD